MALRTVILEPGECITIPSTATVVSITVDGDAAVSSECASLPTPGEYICYKFTWERDNSGSMSDAIFVSLIVGSNTYNVPTTYNDYNTTLIADWIAADPALAGIVKTGCDAQDGNTFILKIKVPDGIDAPQLKIQNDDGDGYHNITYMVGVVDTDCDTCP